MTEKALLTYLEQFISPERILRFKEILEERTRYLTVVTEDVFQLHNTSAVIRSCDIFGIQDLHLIKEERGNRLDKNIAMGAQQWVNLYPYQSTQECINHLRKKGYSIVATTPDHSNAISLDSFTPNSKTALFFGTEKDGLSPSVLSQADQHLNIPMVGFTQSLNISVAVAIVLYSLSTKLRKSNSPWRLSEKEKLSLRIAWTKKTIKGIDEIMERYQNEE